MALPERLAARVAPWCFVLVICATPCMSLSPNHYALDCKLAVPAAIKAGESIPLSFTLENRGKVPLSVLNWNTPLEGFFGKYLVVTGPAGLVAYEGPQVKRGVPESDEYVFLAPGKKAEATVDLALPYRIAKPGRYKVSYTGNLHDVTTLATPRKTENFTGMTIQCPVVEFELQASSPRR